MQGGGKVHDRHKNSGKTKTIGVNALTNLCKAVVYNSYNSFSTFRIQFV